MLFEFSVTYESYYQPDTIKTVTHRNTPLVVNPPGFNYFCDLDYSLKIKWPAGYALGNFSIECGCYLGPCRLFITVDNSKQTDISGYYGPSSLRWIFSQ